jgi:hypothetical protein
MGWQQLISIAEEAKHLAAEEANRLPEDCPRCGERLISGPDAILFCTFDGYRADGSLPAQSLSNRGGMGPAR